MIGAVSCLVVVLAASCSAQSTSSSGSAPRSPCPNVFQYEPSGTEPGRWYGVVNLSTDNTLHSLWLNVVLDSKADILGNWVGDVSTTDNIDFKIENTKMKIHPGPAVAVRFFVQYNPLKTPIPRLQTIRLNGREICNANTPVPADSILDSTSSGQSRPESGRPVSTRPVERPVERPVASRPVSSRPADSRPSIRPEDTPVTRPVHGSPSSSGPVYVPTANPPIDQINVNPFVIGEGGKGQSGSRPNSVYGHTTSSYTTTTTENPDFEDFDTVKKPDPSEYFGGGLHTIVVPSNTNDDFNDNNNNNNNYSPKSRCGKVTLNKPNPLVVNGKPTLEGQWPWQIALYQTQTVDSKYICGGTLVTHLHVITAAHCVTRKSSSRVVNKNTLTVYLGKHNLRTSVRGVQIRLVDEITVHPEYNASSFSHDLAILRLIEPVQYTDYVRPACLWADDQTDLNSVIGKKGSVVGWGFDATGVATEELTLVEMPVVDQETCIRSFSDFFARFTSKYTFCAGYRDGALDKRTGYRKSTSVCNGDSGGGMVFQMNDSWHLRGLVSLSVARQNEYRCDPTHYVVFTDLAKFLPWIRQHINNY
ncbi:PREDICTED: serine proteinase stubble-like isoform X1 [Papilio xuthus]|uniref:Serine proteinase stubble-like isoform X1 n=1 Tax=Papilio xuthus TaxID=66420 RepID=A0AAJ6Z9J1_PAPXU|nr:PREDICTED: serine proteinase stubble-like isoform X1 [Papilio xuthus]